MTLLLTIVSATGIHQSSDYRLTNVTTQPPTPIEDALGSKQLDFSFGAWSAHISFTGIAQAGGRKTRDWIYETLSRAPQSSDVSTVMDDLATSASNELRSVSDPVRKLTIVVSTWEASGTPRLFIISNFERPDGLPLTETLDDFQVYEIVSHKPQVFIFRFGSAVSVADRKLLENLARGNRAPADIRPVLARINARSARQSDGWISEGCLVTSLLTGGKATWENFGRTPGVPAGLEGLGKVLRTLDPEGPPVFVRGGGVREDKRSKDSVLTINSSEGSTVFLKLKNKERREAMFVIPDNGGTATQLVRANNRKADDEDAEWEQSHMEDPKGEPRTISFSSANSFASITDSNGLNLGVVTIGGLNGTITLRKNKLAKTTLNTVTVKIDPSTVHDARPLLGLLQIPSVPTVDRIQAPFLDVCGRCEH